MSKSSIYWIIGLAVLLILAIWQIIAISTEKRGLENSLHELNESLDDSREQRTILIDSLRSLSTKADSEINTTLTEIERLEGVIADLRKKPQYDPNIDNMRDNDSISRLFARYYPDNN